MVHKKLACVVIYNVAACDGSRDLFAVFVWRNFLIYCIDIWATYTYTPTNTSIIHHLRIQHVYTLIMLIIYVFIRYKW